MTRIRKIKVKKLKIKPIEPPKSLKKGKFPAFRNFVWQIESLKGFKLLERNRPFILKMIKNSLYFKKVTNKEMIIRLKKSGVKFVEPINNLAAVIDVCIMHEIFKNKIYTKKYTIKPTDTIIDIGAHRGIASIFFSKLATKGQVYSLEPYLENYELLLRNLKLNNIENVHPINSGVLDSQGKRELGISSVNTGGHSLYDSVLKNKVVAKFVTLKSIIEGNKLKKIDLLKIDCEGAESRILLALNKENFSKINNIALEYHEWMVPGYLNIESLRKHLESMNFEVQVDKKNLMLYAKNKNQR
jgi:FkbM family methyltransferase